MAKKGESDEKVQAGTGPETLGENVPGEPDQREAAALVAGGDPGAIEGEGAELPPGEPADAAGESAGVVSDGQRNGDDASNPAEALSQGDKPLRAGTGGGTGNQPAAGQDHEAGADNSDGMERHGDGAFVFADNGLAAAILAGDANAVENDAEKLDGAHGPNGEIPSGSGAGDDVQGHDADGSADGISNGGDAGGTVSAGGDLRHGVDAGRLDGGELDDGPIDFGDLALGAAVETYQAVLMAGAILGATIAGTDALDADMSDLAYDDMAAFVRKIGKRATPEVMGQQLKILGHRASAEISEPERMALSAFVTALVDLDAFAAAEAARIAAEKNPPAPALSLPIDETTLEPVDDYFSTWT